MRRSLPSGSRKKAKEPSDIGPKSDKCLQAVSNKLRRLMERMARAKALTEKLDA